MGIIFWGGVVTKMRLLRPTWQPILDTDYYRAYGARLIHALLHQLDAQDQAVYRQMMTRLQRDMLLLLMAIGLPLSLFFGVQLFHDSWGALTMPPAMFFIHVVRIGLLGCLVFLFLYRGNVLLAWASALCITLSTLLIEIWLLQEPGLLIFALFSLAGPALVLPLRLNLLLIGGLVLALFLIVRFTFPVYSDSWASVGLFFATLMIGITAMGAVVRNVVRRLARTTVANEREAAQRARVEQQMHDLRQEVERLASLEHDLRQPLRAVQGYLTVLGAEMPDANELTLPAIAAAGRMERLINNLLDQERAATKQPPLLRQRVDLEQFFATLQQTAVGLARYYTDPPIPIHFTIAHMPEIAIDVEQLERALLNLIDNALAYSPIDGSIEVRADSTGAMLAIEVRDRGPGIPDAIIQALYANEPLNSRHNSRHGLGLRQAYSMACAHGGGLSCEATDQGTCVLLALPIAGASQ